MSSNPPTGESLRILIVDDDPVLGGLFVDVLQLRGHHARIAPSGVHALALLAQESFDLVISDLRMPGISGLQLWEHLRVERPRLAEHMILVSAEAPDSAVWDFVRQIGLGSLRKPFHIGELLRLVDQARTALNTPLAEPSSNMKIQ